MRMTRKQATETVKRINEIAPILSDVDDAVALTLGDGAYPVKFTEDEIAVIGSVLEWAGPCEKSQIEFLMEPCVDRACSVLDMSAGISLPAVYDILCDVDAEFGRTTEG